MNQGLYLLEDLWWYYGRYFPVFFGFTLLLLSVIGLAIGGWLQFAGIEEHHMLFMTAIGGAVLALMGVDRAEGGDG